MADKIKTKKTRIPRDFVSHSILKEKYYKCRVEIDGSLKTRYFFCQKYRNNSLGIFVVVCKRFYRKRGVYDVKPIYIRSGSDDFAMWNDMMDILKSVAFDKYLETSNVKKTNRADKFVRVLKDYRDEGIMPDDIKGKLLPRSLILEQFKVVGESDENYTLECRGKIYVVNKLDFEDLENG